MSAFTDWAEGDLAPWVKVNAGFDSVGQGLCFAERPAAHSGLTVGYGGGAFDGNAVADGTVAGLTDNATNYIVVNRSTRAVTSSTATTNWNDTTTYGRMARAVFASGVLTWHDERWSVGGIFRAAGDAIGGSTGSTDNAVLRADGTGGATLQSSGVLIGDSNEISGYKAHLNLQTGTTYTLVAGDTGKIVDHANASAITVTLPNSLAVGFAVTYVQAGAGQITFSPASGATLRNRQSHAKTAGQWGQVSLYVRTNSGGTAAEWVLGGDTAA